MGSRRKSRELALQMLFQAEINRDQPDWKATFWAVHPAPEDVRAYSDNLVEGVLENQVEIDSLIEKYALNWKIPRIANVDRNILRIGVFELTHLKDVPPSVVLNEAIEIAKRYSDDQAGGFVNGILDQIAKEETSASRGA